MTIAARLRTYGPPALLAGYLLLRLRNNLFENDELQHLHVVWSWTRGLVQYKDVFDNHAPLYHLLAGAVLRLSGAGSAAGWLLPARSLSLAVFAGLLAAAYRLSQKVFGLEPGEALTAACLLGASAPFMAMAARPEPLWLLFFFLSLLLFSGDKTGPGRAFLAGLANGAGAAVSLKTAALLLPAQLLALAALALARRSRPDWKAAPAFAAGLAAVPTAVLAYFAHLDALRELLYYAFTYNTSGAPMSVTAAKAALLAAAAAAAVPLLRLLARRAGDALFFYAATALFLGLLLAVYPVMEHQTVLPLRLLLYLAAAAGAARLFRYLPGTDGQAALAFLFCAVLAAQLFNTAALERRDAGQLAYLERVRSLAGDGGYVMDAKGESVFGRRPFYYGLELLALRRLAAGEIADDIPERLRATETKLALLWLSARFSARDLAFIRSNYLPLPAPYESLYAAGREVPLSGGRGAFSVEIPAEYAVSCAGGGLPALDGRPAEPYARLEAGSHTAAAGPACGTVKLLWARATEAP